jgi:hypothetical protein
MVALLLLITPRRLALSPRFEVCMARAQPRAPAALSPPTGLDAQSLPIAQLSLKHAIDGGGQRTTKCLTPLR